MGDLLSRVGVGGDLVIMFLPKKRQRTALGKYDLYENIASKMMRTGQREMQDRDRGAYRTGKERKGTLQDQRPISLPNELNLKFTFPSCTYFPRL